MAQMTANRTYTGMDGLRVNLCEIKALQLEPNCKRKWELFAGKMTKKYGNNLQTWSLILPCDGEKFVRGTDETKTQH
jgi:hypothetical protein